jgi:hypothetical protein
MKKKLSMTAMALCIALVMAGCGEKFPELTEDEYNHTVEYAAGLLMKYSNNGQERLVVVDAKEVEKQRKKEAQAAAEQASQEASVKPEPVSQPIQPEPEPEPEPETENLTTDPENQTAQEPEKEPEQEPEQETQTASNVDPNAIVLSSEQSQEIVSDIFLSYQGYMVSSTYPESSKSYVVNADKGKKLLVLRFDLYNGSNGSKDVNMIPLNLSFKIILNGQDIGYSSVTFLPNDLTSYKGTIDSRAHESVVVLTQISEKDSKNIDTLGMTVSYQGKTQNVVLQ